MHLEVSGGMSLARKIDPVQIKISNDFGAEFGVSGQINDNDFIYWYDFDCNSSLKKEDISLSYMQVGRATAHIVRDLLAEHKPSRPDFSILDFASGYGRVSRWMNEAMPSARVFASDIHQDAIDFMKSIGIEAFKSSANPEEFSTPQKFDVIFALSFFTHMPKSTWGRWLKRLTECLEPGGLLIFTTHGDTIWPALGKPEIDSEGFWFLLESEQKDLDVSEYGNNYTSIEYVLKQIRETRSWVESVRSPGIGAHDIFVIRKVDSSVMPPPYVPPPEPEPEPEPPRKKKWWDLSS
jgi:2-polyprenyl-3-methyl-5-hydroxy-6-metoxy-1,4-benzoquinol methylase